MDYHCSLFEKGRIIQLREDGMSVAQIANETGRARITIRRWLERFQGEGEAGMPQRQKTGRRPKTAGEEDHSMTIKYTFSRHIKLYVRYHRIVFATL